jgi:hypothetical protein
MHSNPNSAPIYSATFASVSISTAEFDAFGILAPANSRVVIHEIRLGMQSTNPVNQTLGVRILRGSTAASAGTALTPRHIHGWTGAPSAGSSVTQPSSALVSTASAVLVFADNWHFHDDVWIYRPCPEDRLVLEASQRLHVRVTGPTTTTPIYGTLTFAETGRGLPS